MKNFLRPAALIMWASCTGLAQTVLQSPDAFLGYPLGTRITPHARVVAYVEYAVAQSPTRSRLIRYGETTEGRPLLAVVVASEDNLNQLEEIRANNLRRVGLLTGAPTAGGPAIVWLSHSVHGNESSGTVSAMFTLYELLNPANAAAQGWLKNAVVILDPSLNPDGYDRFVNFSTQASTNPPTPTSDAREHREPWPGGRQNHYLFDLNRDWAWQSQRESQLRMAFYHQWMPHVHADIHEQGANSPYYFAPAAEPYHERITPWQREFQTTIGKNNARYFDKNGWLYFTKERFDLFYPSYGDTYPTYKGAIGMTYEQGSARGLNVVLQDGDTLTFKDAVLHHQTTALATVEITAQNAERVTREFQQFFDNNRNRPASPYKSFVVKGTNDRGKLESLTQLLTRNQIAFGGASAGRRLTAYNYATGKTAATELSTNDLIISAYQPMSVLAEVLFEPRSTLRDSSTYDITAWSLPYAYGLQAFATAERLVPTAAFVLPAPPAAPAGVAAYAYLVRWTNARSVAFLAAVLQKKVRVRFAELPFAVDGRVYEAGTLVLTRGPNEGLGNQFDQIVKEAAAKTGITPEAATTGFVASGKDFGSDYVRLLNAPKVAVLAGRGASVTAVGEVWHFMESLIGYPFTMLDTDYFAAVDLAKYDVLVVPSGSYASTFTDNVLRGLQTWVRGGGRLVLMENAIAAVADREGWAAKKYESDAAKKTAEEKDKEEKLKTRLQPYADRERNALSADIPGAVYRATLDPTHPLAFGYGKDFFTLKQNNSYYPYFQDAWNVGVLKKDGYLTGFVGNKIKPRQSETTIFGVQELGKGQVIYLVDDPIFRGFWVNGQLLFANALFFSGQ